MKKLITLLSLLLFTTNLLAAGKIQNEDVKTLTELTNAGGSASQLINDSKIYVTANGLNKQLSAAIVAGDIGGGGGGGVQLLSNSGFESSAGASPTAWTVTTATGADETSIIYAGSHSEKLTYSSSLGDIAQSVTPTVNTLNVSMEASCKINTTMTTIQVCSLSGGTEIQCVSAPSSGTWQYVSATMIGPSNGTTVGVRVKTSSSASGTVYIDDCYVGPNRLFGTGALAADFTSYSPTLGAGYGTATNNTAYYRRVGDAMEVYGSFTTGTVAASSSAIGLPSGYSIDPAKVSIANTTSNPGQEVGRLRGQATNNFMTLVTATGTSTASVFMSGLESNGTSLTPANANAVLSSSTFATYHFVVPIQGWTSNSSAYRADVTPASYYGFSSGATWSTTSGSYVDPTVSGTPALTSSGTPRNITCSQSGTNPAISCALPRSGNYQVCARATADNTTSGDAVDIKLVDGSGTQISAAGIFSTFPMTMPLCGGYTQSAAGSTVFKLQMKQAGGGTANIATGSTGNIIEWSVIELDAPMPAPYLIGLMPRSTVQYRGLTGFGSTSTAIPQYTTQDELTGTAFSVTSNSTVGTVITMNEAGVVTCEAGMDYAATGIAFGITLNSLELTTSVGALSTPSKKKGFTICNAAGSGYACQVSATMDVAVGDVIRAHADTGRSPGANASQVLFRCTKASN